MKTTARERQELRATIDNLREKERNEAGENARLEERLAEARAELATAREARDAAEARRDDLVRARESQRHLVRRQDHGLAARHQATDRRLEQVLAHMRVHR